MEQSQRALGATSVTMEQSQRALGATSVTMEQSQRARRAPFGGGLDPHAPANLPAALRHASSASPENNTNHTSSIPAACASHDAIATAAASSSG